MLLSNLFCLFQLQQALHKVNFTKFLKLNPDPHWESSWIWIRIENTSWCRIRIENTSWCRIRIENNSWIRIREKWCGPTALLSNNASSSIRQGWVSGQRDRFLCASTVLVHTWSACWGPGRRGGRRRSCAPSRYSALSGTAPPSHLHYTSTGTVNSTCEKLLKLQYSVLHVFSISHLGQERYPVKRIVKNEIKLVGFIFSWLIGR